MFDASFVVDKSMIDRRIKSNNISENFGVYVWRKWMNALSSLTTSFVLIMIFLSLLASPSHFFFERFW